MRSAIFRRQLTSVSPRSTSLVILFAAGCSGRAETVNDGTPQVGSGRSLSRLSGDDIPGKLGAISTSGPHEATSVEPEALLLAIAGEGEVSRSGADVEPACTHVPLTCDRVSQPLRAAGEEATELPRLSPGASYGVQLAALDEAGATPSAHFGFVSFTPEYSGRYELLIGTPNMPLRVLEEGAEIGRLCTRRVSAAECDAFRRVNVYELNGGVEYRIELGPIEPQRWVRLRFEAPPRPVDARLVFAAALGGETQRDLYSIREDGSGLARLTFTAEQSESAARWSPDFSKVSFLAGSELFALDVASGDVVALAAQVGRNGQGLTPAAWSPDGTRLLYPHPRPPWVVEFDDGEIVDESYSTLLHFVDANGDSDVPFPEPPDGGQPPGLGSWSFPTWFADGRIAARLGDDCPDCPGGWWYALVREDGSELQSINFGPNEDFPESDLDWSPAGERWVYTTLSGRVGSASTSDALDSVVLTTSGSHTARWSPDGASVAFLRADGIYLVDADGGNERRIFAADGVAGLDW